MKAQSAPVCTIILAPVAAFERCSCPECRRLYSEHPREGYQLTLFPYRLGLPMMRR